MANAPLDEITTYARTHAPAGSVPDAAGAAQETGARLPTREALDRAVLLCGRAVEDAGRGWAEEARCRIASALDRLDATPPDDAPPAGDGDDWPWREVQDRVASAAYSLTIARGRVADDLARALVADAVESLRRAHALCCGEVPRV